MTTRLPSWAHHLSDEHMRLGRLLGTLRISLASAADDSWENALLQLLEQITHEVREHMAFEERGGYLAPVQERMPGLTGTIEQMRTEHSTLQSRLAEILTRVRTQPGVYVFRVEITPQIEQWLDSMRDHERRENLLVQDALNTDVSVCD